MVHEEYPTDITKENLPALVEKAKKRGTKRLERWFS